MPQMTSMRRFFVEQLRDKLTQTAAVAKRAEVDARDAARTMATESEKKEDARTMLEFGSYATGQQARVAEAQQQIQLLDDWLVKGLPEFGAKSAVALGAMVDVVTEDKDGQLERTFMLLPVGAGTELLGPGGDGFISVVTPQSPVGKALLGKRRGDVADVTIKGEPYEWEVLAVS